MRFEEVIETELKCVQRDCCRLENQCANCDLVLPQEEIVNAYKQALKLKAQIEKMKEQLDYSENERKRLQNEIIQKCHLEDKQLIFGVSN